MPWVDGVFLYEAELVYLIPQFAREREKIGRHDLIQHSIAV